MSLVKKGITARRIITHAAIENAVSVLMGIGGSTNGILHLQAIHREAGLGDLPLSVFDDFSRKTPQVASVYPASPYDMADFHEAGGVPAVMLELQAYLHRDALTVTGKTVGENLGAFSPTARREIIRTAAEPFSEEGGVAVLRGNLAPLGSVIKPAAVPAHLYHFEGKAQVFQSEQESIRAILDGKVQPGTAVVLRYEGPKGGPGMPEMYRPMKSLEGMALSDSCAIVTDGRFSGSNRGCFVGHISPEAYEGSPLALVRDGDTIRIDIPARSIELLVSDAELERRRREWVCPQKDIPAGYLQTYRRTSKSAAEGAVVE